MKNVKRILAVLLALVMVLGLVACGGGGGEDESNTNDGDTEEVYGEGYVLKVGMNCGAAPFGWTQDDDSNDAWPIDGTNQYVCGYDVWLAEKICDTYGWDLKIIKTDWEGLIPGVQSGKLDCCISTLGVSEERLQVVDFSDYYWNNGCIMVVRKDSPYANATSLEDFDGAKITTQIATIWEPLVQQIPNVQAEPLLSGLPELFVAVASGKVDGIITGLSEAQSGAMANPDLTWVTFDEGKGFDVPLSQLCAAIPIQKGNTELKEKCNAVIATLSEQDKLDMMTRALNAQPLAETETEALQAEETKDM